MRGSCLCGDVAWEGAGEGHLVHHCHCGMCRKTTGTAFVTMGGFDAATFRFTERGDVTRYRSSASLERCFCARCGSWVPGDPSGEQVYVTFGSLDDDPGGRPLAHIFVASKAPWYEIRDALPRFDAYPPGFAQPELTAPQPRGVGVPGGVGGSCLCGAVAYEIEGPVDAWYNCHCSRCRRAGGGAHASNLFLDARRFRWVRGERELASYVLPEAPRFGRSFCRTCGAKAPRVSAEFGHAAIPTGSLDDDPGSRPQCHIFVASKAPWFEIADDLPQSAGPPR